MIFWRSVFLLGFLTCCVAVVTAQDNDSNQTSDKKSEPSSSSVPLDDIQAFAAVYRAIKNVYVDQTDDKKLLQGAIRGLLSSLDPHSEYLDQRGLTQLDEASSGEYAGLGVEVLYFDGRLRVIAPIDGSPASRAGIKSGDIILSIDNQWVPTTQGAESVEWLRGKTGSSVVLSIAREGVESPLEFKLTREIIKVASVQSRWLEKGYLYLRIAQFQEETAQEMASKIKAQQKKHALRGAVVDLRNNPGGLLDAAIAVSDLFLEQGVIVSTKGRMADTNVSMHARPGDLMKGMPLVVLIDAGTASAAEIVAGALKDHHRAVLMGQRSFGKGSVQSVVPLLSGDALKITTARYYTPSGISIQASGISPDIELADRVLSVPDRAASVATMAERDLPGHLLGDFEQVMQPEIKDKKMDTGNDYALNEAFNVLKGLVLLHEQHVTGSKKAK